MRPCGWVLLLVAVVPWAEPLAVGRRGGGGGKRRGRASSAGTSAGSGIRVNRVLCEKFSRREADRLVAEQRVSINGAIAAHGDTVGPGDSVKLDGKRIPFPHHRIAAPATAEKKHRSSSSSSSSSSDGGTGTGTGTGPVPQQKPIGSAVYIVYNKPAGVECTTDRRVAGNIVDAVGHKQRIFPVGRLDKDTTGIILLTTNGDLPNACLRAERKKPKTYEVTADKPVAPADVRRLSEGVVITTTSQSSKKSRPLTARTKPCKVSLIGGGGGGRSRSSSSSSSKRGGRRVRVTLVEGRNRQVRKMFRALGYTVKKLHRSSFMGMTARDVPVGSWRLVNAKERKTINEALDNAAVAAAVESAAAAADGDGDGDDDDDDDDGDGH